MSKGPPFLPGEITCLKKPCPKCGAELRPRLWEDCDSEFTPIYPSGTHGERGAWIQITSTTHCECGGEVHFALNPKKLVHPVYFYGDDADRSLDPYSLHSYSLIGGTSGTIEQIATGLLAIKSKHLPSLDPESWRIHATTMMSGQKRVVHPVYKNISKDTVMELFEDCAALLKTWQKCTWNMHVLAIANIERNKKKRRMVQSEMRTVAHQALLSQSIYLATQKELRPVFTLDASRPVKHYPHIENWSYGTYADSRKYLAHAFLTHSNDIDPPSLVDPGSHPCLEMADVHAFWAARSVFKRFQGKNPELALSTFGAFRYMTVKHSGRVEFNHTDDIPEAYFLHR